MSGWDSSRIQIPQAAASCRAHATERATGGGTIANARGGDTLFVLSEATFVLSEATFFVYP